MPLLSLRGAAPTDHGSVSRERPACAAWRPTSAIFFSECRIGATLSRAVGAIDDDDDGGGAGVRYGVVVRNTPTAQHRNGSTSFLAPTFQAGEMPLFIPSRAARTDHGSVSRERPACAAGGRRRRFLFSEWDRGNAGARAVGRSMMMMMVVVPA